jgi:hypothetical protein
VRRGVVAAVAASLALTGCSLGERQAQADRIIAAVDLLDDAAALLGTLSAQVRVIRLPDAAGVMGLDADDVLGAGASAGSAAAEVVIEPATRRAALATAERGRFEIFDGDAVYGRRYDAQANEARPWLVLDLGDIGDGVELDLTADPPALVMNALSPVLLVDLIAGVLAGSVREVGADDVGGVATVHYEANFDIDKSVHDTRESRYDEDRREALDDLLDLLGADGRVHAGDVWLDDEGRPRRFVLNFVVSPQRGFEVAVDLDLTLTGFGPVGEPIAVPEDRELVQLESLVAFLRSIVPPPATAFPLGGA